MVRCMDASARLPLRPFPCRLFSRFPHPHSLLPSPVLKRFSWLTGGKILGVLALFLVMVWYSIYREDRCVRPRGCALRGGRSHPWQNTEAGYPTARVVFAQPMGASSKNNSLLFPGERMGTAFNLSPCSFYFPVQENKTVCPIGEVERKAAQLIGK